MATLIRPFKNLLLLIFLLGTCFADLFAQLPDLSPIEKARAENALLGNRNHDLNFITPKTNPSIQSPSITSKQNLVYRQSVAQRAQTGNCLDSSFKKLFEALNRSYSFLCSARTSDGGILIGGFGRSMLDGPPYKWYSILTKFDSIGNHLWSREIRSDVQTALYIESISELKDGSILVSGWHENTLSVAPPTPNVDFFVSKLSSTGNLVWLNTYHSLLGNGCTTSNIRFASFAEGANGDIYIAGTIPNCPLPMYLVVFKINNIGTLQWKYSYAVPEDTYGVGIFYEGNYITVINRASESGAGIVHIDLLKLNESSGVYISHKSWQIGLPYPLNFYAGFVSWSPQAIRLNNGNYCVYGPTFGDFILANTDQPHFAVLEFNNNYDFVKGYTINSSLTTNPSESRIKVDRFGRVIYMLTTFSNWLNKTKYIGSADNAVIINQRKRDYTNMEIFYDNFELFDDGSYVYIDNMATPGQANFYLEYSLLHNSDTGSICLGLRDNFSHIVPLQYIPYNFTWLNINPNPLIATNNQNNSSIPIDYFASAPCFEKTYCDILKIHGNSASCDVQQVFTFTSFKNRECGSVVNWTINPSVVQVFQPVDDTTIQVKLNQPWQGWLHAEIMTACGRVKDSLLITVIASPGAVNIGADTALCPGNTILLNARRGYTSYRWNDGTVDSLLIVNSPGKYYVDVSDACGNFFSDTVNVLAAPPVPFYIGPDKSKCNSDTLHLSAPSGFLNYTWSNNYNINSTTSQNVVINPLMDTAYYIKAEKTTGCFAYDTVKVTVHHSPSINLGADKSFCFGDSVIFNAGNGFNQYLWSNNTTSQQITVKNAGMYSVMGTTVESCKSYDTVKVLAVFTNPVVNLDHSNSLCTGSTRILDAGSFSSYLWNDGSTGRKITIKNMGMYNVEVTDNNGCKGWDTTIINIFLPLPAAFLPPDTVICSYSKIVLMPNASYSSYLWNNNATTSSITISLPGAYWLQVKDQNNCAGRDSILVNPKDCMEGFYIPTAFTPNNDGKNDVFRPMLFGNVIKYKFTIYNRWGEIVFQTSDLNKGWGGNYKSLQQPADVYIWTCTYQFEGEQLKAGKGTVVLIH